MAFRMNLYRFSFKSEALWILVFAFAPAILGILILLVVKIFNLIR